MNGRKTGPRRQTARSIVAHVSTELIPPVTRHTSPFGKTLGGKRGLKQSPCAICVCARLRESHQVISHARGVISSERSEDPDGSSSPSTPRRADPRTFLVSGKFREFHPRDSSSGWNAPSSAAILSSTSSHVLQLQNKSATARGSIVEFTRLR